VQVLLHNYVAARCEESIFGTDIRSVDCRLRSRALRAIDKADEITIIEIPKAMYFVDHGNRIAELCHDLLCQLETEVHALCTNVKQQIARRSDCLPRASLDFPKRMQLRWPRLTKEPVPRVRSNSHRAGEITFDIAETDRT
jgi:hypothetical protein